MLFRSFRSHQRLQCLLAFCQASQARVRGYATALTLPEIDAKWQNIWERQEQPLRPPLAASEKSYVLPMFAYPSGTLHMGHLRVYTISDVIARYKRMRGLAVLHPTGWDAFGLPAENAAIERGIDPAGWTDENIQKMRQQLKSMNTSFDWDAEISTCSPSFYKHTQKLFLMLYKSGLAYQNEAFVNWDPVDKTVLANEQVDSNGRSWRSGAIVEQVKLRQWFFRITKYAKHLHRGLDFLAQDNKWPERVLTQQRNWLGPSEGARIRFNIRGSRLVVKHFARRAVNSSRLVPKKDHVAISALTRTHKEAITVFTTRPDTVFGVTYLALSTSHPLVLAFAEVLPDLSAFLDRSSSSQSDSKDGFLLPVTVSSPVGSFARIPVYVAPYVLGDYGSGAVMGVPAHDNRDLAFWKRHRPDEGIPIVVTTTECPIEKTKVMPSELPEAQTKPGILTSLCGNYSGLTSQEAIQKLRKDIKLMTFTTWKLRDWLVSRQRYWGTPIPIIHCQDCGPVPVPDDQLPVVLPKLHDVVKGAKGNPLENAVDWVNCQCPLCSKAAKRETDTMDTFVDSSWYYARFPDSTNATELFSRDSATAMLPVDIYVGGVEHAILHLLYARFIYKFLADEGFAPPTKNIRLRHFPPQEPFSRLVAQGMVHGKTFSDPGTGRFLVPHELSQIGDETKVTASGLKPNVTWEKMSKSKHNGVDPAACITKYGADTTRAHILFAAPISEILQWDEQKIVGIQRWFGRVQRVVDNAGTSKQLRITAVVSAEEVSDVEDPNAKPIISNTEADLLLLTHNTVQSVTNTFEEDIYSLNTTISDLIKLTNALDDADVSQVRPHYYQTMIAVLLRMLAPIAPAFAEQCWEGLSPDRNKWKHQHKHTSILRANLWPESFLTPGAKRALQSMLTEMTCAVQVNGKLRFTAMVPRTKEEDKKTVPQEQVDRILETVLATEEGKLWLRERNQWGDRKKVIVVKGGQLVNVVF